LARGNLRTILSQADEEQSLELFQNKKLEQLFYKTWLDNGINNTSPIPEGWLRLNPDRSFEGESLALDGSFSGTWHIKPSMEVRNNLGTLLGSYMDMVFRYELGGESFAETVRIETARLMKEAFQGDNANQPSISLCPKGSVCYFRDPTYYSRGEALLTADELCAKVLPGTWICPRGDSPELIFTEDGRYYSEEDPNFKGTWSFGRADIAATDYGHRMICELQFLPEEGEAIRADLDFGDIHDLKRPFLYLYSQSGSSSYSKKTADADTYAIYDTAMHDAPTLISGQWISSDGKYSMRVESDGSFSATLDKDYSGTWEVQSTSIKAKGQYIWTSIVTCRYSLNAEGMPEGSTAEIPRGVPSFCKAESIVIKLDDKSFELNRQ